MLSLEVLIILNYYLVISLAISVTFLHSQICSLYYIYISRCYVFNTLCYLRNKINV